MFVPLRSLRLSFLKDIIMANLLVFNFLSLNGFFKGPNGDTNWHLHGADENEYGLEGIGQNNTLLFGRITYEMMSSFWPTEQALQLMPDMAKGMNKAEKIVFSRTLKKATWNNTRIVNKGLLEEVQQLKQAGKNLTLLGSGTIVTQLAEAGLIDHYELMIDPILLGEGTPFCQHLKKSVRLKLTNSRTFKSGIIVLSYVPA